MFKNVLAFLYDVKRANGDVQANIPSNVDGVKSNIVAFKALDWGSIPGQRMICYILL